MITTNLPVLSVVTVDGTVMSAVVPHFRVTALFAAKFWPVIVVATPLLGVRVMLGAMIVNVAVAVLPFASVKLTNSDEAADEVIVNDPSTVTEPSAPLVTFAMLVPFTLTFTLTSG